MWYTGSGAITAFIAAIPIYLGSALIKKSSNAKLFAQIRLADWFERRRGAVGSALLLNDADALKSFGSTDRPTHALRLLQDVAAMILLLGLAFGAILYLTQSDNTTQFRVDKYYASQGGILLSYGRLRYRQCPHP